MLLLRSTLNARIGRTGLPAAYVAQLWGSAVAGAAVAWGVKIALPPLHPIRDGRSSCSDRTASSSSR